MNLEELKTQEAKIQVRQYIKNIFDHTHIDKKQDEEIRKILKESLKQSVEAAMHSKSNTDELVISEANVKRKKAEEKIVKFNEMLKVFDEEFENFMRQRNIGKKLTESVAILKKEKDIDVNEIVEKIKKEAEDKYPIPQGGDER